MRHAISGLRLVLLTLVTISFAHAACGSIDWGSYWFYPTLDIQNHSTSISSTAYAASYGAWNGIQSYLTLQNGGQWGDILLYDGGGGTDADGITYIYPYDSTHACYHHTDFCGRCIDSSWTYQAVIYLNSSLIASDAASYYKTTDWAMQAAFSHELGHALNQAHSTTPLVCASMNTIMYPYLSGILSLLSCNINTPQATCDGSGVGTVYNPAPEDCAATCTDTVC
jgi:hypothetical protein